MPNSIKNLNITATSEDYTISGVTWEKWDNESHTVALVSNGQAITPNLNIFYPETKYAVSASGVDEYDYPITISFDNNTDYFITKNDYPAFSDFYIGSRNFRNGYFYFNLSEKATVKTGLTSIPKWYSSGGDKDFLNTPTYINQNSFEVEGLVDNFDPNAFDPVEIYRDNWVFADTDSDFYKEHYLYAEDSNMSKVQNILPSNRDIIIGFDTFNSKLGLHKITFQSDSNNLFTMNNTVTFNQDGALISDKGRDTFSYPLSSSYGSLSNLISGTTITGIPNILNFLSNSGEKIYGCKNNDNIYTFIGIRQKYDFTANWPEYEDFEYNDSGVYLIGTGISKCRKTSNGQIENNASRSNINIKFKTYFPPKIKANYSYNGVLTNVEKKLDDGNSIIDTEKYDELNQISSPTWLSFVGDYYTNVHYGVSPMPEVNDAFHFDVTTNAYRPFLPLFNYQFDSDQPILSSDTYTFADNYLDSNYFDANGLSDGTKDALESVHRMTPLVVEALYYIKESNPYEYLYPYRMSGFDGLTYYEKPDFSEIPQDIFDAIRENDAMWGAIGGCPTDDMHGTYNFDEDFYDSSNTAILNRASIKNPSTNVESFANSKQNRITWPVGVAKLNKLSSSSSNPTSAVNLIPNTYYFFRVTAANYCGTTSKIFAIKTHKPSPMTFTTSVSFNTTGSGSTSNIPGSSVATEISVGNEEIDNNLWFNINAGDYLYFNTTTLGGTGYDAFTTINPSNTKSISIYYWTWDSTNSTWINKQEMTLSAAATWNSFGSAPFQVSSGKYKVELRSTALRYANTTLTGNIFSENYWLQQSHIYYFNVTDSNSLQVNNNGATINSPVSATITGSYTKTGSHNITDTGFEWYESTTSGTIHDIDLQSTSSSLTSNLTVEPGKTYYYRSYAISNDTTLGTNGKVYASGWVNFTVPNTVGATITISNETRTGVSITVE